MAVWGNAMRCFRSGAIDVSVTIRCRLRKETGMSGLFCLTNDQTERLQPFLPKSHGKPRMDDRASAERHRIRQSQGPARAQCAQWVRPHKTLQNRWKCGGEAGIFMRMMKGLAAAGAEPQTVMIDATDLKARPTASSLRVKKTPRARTAPG